MDDQKNEKGEIQNDERKMSAKGDKVKQGKPTNTITDTAGITQRQLR